MGTPGASKSREETRTSSGGFTMMMWIAITTVALMISGVSIRIALRERKKRLVATRRVVERPNSYYASKGVQDQQDAEWWSQIRSDRLHEVNREYVNRLLVKVEAAGVDSLNRDERAFLERIADLEAPGRVGLRPEQQLWPFPA
jgi:hypothetical protein